MENIQEKDHIISILIEEEEKDVEDLLKSAGLASQDGWGSVFHLNFLAKDLYYFGIKKLYEG